MSDNIKESLEVLDPKIFNPKLVRYFFLDNSTILFNLNHNPMKTDKRMNNFLKNNN